MKTLDQEAANRYFSYHEFIKASYSDLSSLCKDIDRAEWEMGRIEGSFYPVVQGIIEIKASRWFTQITCKCL